MVFWENNFEVDSNNILELVNRCSTLVQYYNIRDLVMFEVCYNFQKPSLRRALSNFFVNILLLSKTENAVIRFARLRLDFWRPRLLQHLTQYLELLNRLQYKRAVCQLYSIQK